MQACVQQYRGVPEAVTSDRCCSQLPFQQAHRTFISKQMQFGFAPSMKEKNTLWKILTLNKIQTYPSSKLLEL